MLKATHSAPLTIAGITLDCAVLEDGTRVLSRAGFIKAIGRTGKAKGGRKFDQEFKVPVFLTADNLKPFIDNDLIENSKPVPYRNSGVNVLGYKAELLPQVCNIFIKAKIKHVLRDNQEHIYERCQTLLGGFALVGITALIDEATGYQEIRDKLALQKILDKYLRKADAEWAKRFPDEFYIEMFKLRGWTWKGIKVNRPSIVGRYTNDLIYERLAPGVLTELRKRNPVLESGNRRVKHHQFLTEDIGHPALAQHLHAVIGLMRASGSWDGFYRLLQRAFPKLGETIPLALEE